MKNCRRFSVSAINFLLVIINLTAVIVKATKNIVDRDYGANYATSQDSNDPDDDSQREILKDYFNLDFHSQLDTNKNRDIPQRRFKKIYSLPNYRHRRTHDRPIIGMLHDPSLYTQDQHHPVIKEPIALPSSVLKNVGGSIKGGASDEQHLTLESSSSSSESDEIPVLRSSSGGWAKKCQKAASKQCKKACKAASKKTCEEYSCKKGLKKALKKSCKSKCKDRFLN